MRKQFEHFLLSILVALSVLLGLTFWLNIKFGFNLLSRAHWHELSVLQASNVNIDKNFYVSIGIAIAIFIMALYIIYRPRFRKIPMPKPQKIEIHQLPAIIQPETNRDTQIVPLEKQEKIEQQPVPKPEQKQNSEPIITQQPLMAQQTQKIENTMPQNTNLSRPPRLNLPKNMAQIAANQYNSQITNKNKEEATTQFDGELSEIFSNCAYLVKKNHTIAGLRTNLFAIGNKELVWVGCVDCDINKMKNLVNKLQETFKQTIPDIPITVYSFILDTKKTYESDPDIFIFHDIEAIRKFIFENQGTDIAPEFQEDFDAYSEYIDTVLTLLSNH